MGNGLDVVVLSCWSQSLAQLHWYSLENIDREIVSVTSRCSIGMYFGSSPEGDVVPGRDPWDGVGDPVVFYPSTSVFLSI